MKKTSISVITEESFSFGLSKFASRYLNDIRLPVSVFLLPFYHSIKNERNSKTKRGRTACDWRYGCTLPYPKMIRNENAECETASIPTYERISSITVMMVATEFHRTSL